MQQVNAKCKVQNAKLAEDARLSVAQKRDLQEHSPVGEHVAKRLSSLQANVEGTAAVLKKTSLRGFFGVRDRGG